MAEVLDFSSAVVGGFCGRQEWRRCLLLDGDCWSGSHWGFRALLLLLLLLLICDRLGLGMYPPRLGRGGGCWCSGLRVKMLALAVLRSAIVVGMLR